LLGVSAVASYRRPMANSSLPLITLARAARSKTVEGVSPVTARRPLSTVRAECSVSWPGSTSDTGHPTRAEHEWVPEVVRRIPVRVLSGTSRLGLIRPSRFPGSGDSISAMGWGTVETEPEVTAWLESLTDDDFGQAERYIDLLAEQGVHLTEPFSRQLDGKLRELRFYLDRQPTRISYYIATGRIIVLLTVFTKTKPRERAEIDRARRAMKRCIDEGHITANEENS
jgi:hypothetical protein